MKSHPRGPDENDAVFMPGVGGAVRLMIKNLTIYSVTFFIVLGVFVCLLPALQLQKVPIVRIHTF